MGSTLIHLPYFPNVAHMVAILNSQVTFIEAWDNYNKQTYRNRTKILGPNGILNLTIPVIHSQKNRLLYKDVKIKNTENWQLNHWRSIETSYNSSPFFEFYRDELAELYQSAFEDLYGFNLRCLEVISDILDLKIDLQRTPKFQNNWEERNDYRFLIKAKKETVFNFDAYTQVFSEKYGFASNLSILDLLFNEGPNSESYLREQTI